MAGPGHFASRCCWQTPEEKGLKVVLIMNSNNIWSSRQDICLQFSEESVGHCLWQYMSADLMGVNILPASTYVETSVPEWTGWEETAPVHTCQKEACQSPWAHSPRKRNAPQDGQFEVAGSNRWRFGAINTHLSVVWTRPCNSYIESQRAQRESVELYASLK